jgi:hypothetical protein
VTGTDGLGAGEGSSDEVSEGNAVARRCIYDGKRLGIGVGEGVVNACVGVGEGVVDAERSNTGGW